MIVSVAEGALECEALVGLEVGSAVMAEGYIAAIVEVM